jgi:hypothetical protein
LIDDVLIADFCQYVESCGTWRDININMHCIEPWGFGNSEDDEGGYFIAWRVVYFNALKSLSSRLELNESEAMQLTSPQAVNYVPLT